MFALIPFTFNLVHENLIGTDTYYFLNEVCGKNNGVLFNQPPLMKAITPLIPCNTSLIKTILFLVMLGASTIIALTGNLFWKNGWLAGIFVYASPIWIYEWVKFENDQFAYFFLILSTYFACRFLLKREKKDLLFTYSMVIIAGGFWQGAVYYLLAYGLLSPISAIIAGITIIFFNIQLVSNLLPNMQYLESTPIIALFFLEGLLLPLAYWIHTRKHYLYWFPALFFLLITAINLKFSLHVVPFLSLIAVDLFNHLKEISKKQLLITITIALMLGFSISLASMFPNHNTLQAIQFAVKESQKTSKPLGNAWSIGHIVRYYGGQPSAAFSPTTQDLNGYVVVTPLKKNCKMIKYFFSARVYQC